jgi:fructuronate reductase
MPNAQTLPRLSDRTIGLLRQAVLRPGYDRSRVAPGIVHLGIGAFHRAHQAVVFDDCLGRGETCWGIIAASLRSPATRDALAPQDWLYTLCVRGEAPPACRVIGSVLATLVAPEDPAALIRAMTDPRIRIVTLTITEKGYCANLATGDLMADHPEILHDLASPGEPRTALGFLVAALRQRRAMGTRPFTILSCDNLPANGRFLKRVLSRFAALRDPDLAAYIEAEVACPSSMVDRIVPATTDADRTEVAALTGLCDAWPVVAEPFFQWVVEDDFPAGRPGMEASGVEFTSDIAAHEEMKLRLLNGAHSAMAAIGRVAGYQTVAAAYSDPAIRAFIGRFWAEVIPSLTGGLDAKAYADRLALRFANPSLQHRTAQIATDASRKLPQRILAPLQKLRASGVATPALCLVVAAWIRSCERIDEFGGLMPVNDPQIDGWAARPGPGAAVEDTVSAFLALTPVFGPDLSQDRDFAREVSKCLSAIRRDGVLQAVCAG